MGSPSPNLLALSPAELADLAWKEITARMQCPVMSGPVAGGGRYVEVLGSMGYLVEPERRRVQPASARGHGRFDRGGERDWLSLDPLLPGDTWVAHFLANWVADCMPHADREATMKAVRSIEGSAASTILAYRVREARLVHTLRPRLERALDLDRDILRWVNLGKPDGQRTILSSREYNAMWEHVLRLRQLERENPRLVRAYAGAVLCGVGPDRGEPAQGLKQCFIEHGIGKSGWKLLCNTPAEAFRVPLRMAANDFTFDVYVWAINTFLAARCVLPDAVLERLIAPHFRDPRPGAPLEWCYADVTGEWHSFLRALGRRVATIASEAEMARFLDEELSRVHDWLDATEPTISANQSRAGWPWMLRQAHEWELAEREKALALRITHHWPEPLAYFDCGALTAVALTDSFELWQEGEAMRHCVRLYSKGCLEGRYAIFSVRSRSDDRRLATVSLAPSDGGWAVHQVRVFANRDAGADLKAFAQTLACACASPARSASEAA
jgi:PcfJ-like protein